MGIRRGQECTGCFLPMVPKKQPSPAGWAHHVAHGLCVTCYIRGLEVRLGVSYAWRRRDRRVALELEHDADDATDREILRERRRRLLSQGG